METKSKSKWILSLENSAEGIGGEILLIKNVVVDYTKSYNEIILKGETTPSRRQALEIANECEPSKHEIIKETVILFRYYDWMRMGNADYTKAIEWGLSNNLCKTTLHAPLAAIEQNLYLRSKNSMRFIVATASCNKHSYFACYERGFMSDPDGAGIYCQYQSGLMEAWFSFTRKH